jgi:hypothetical protein
MQRMRSVIIHGFLLFTVVLAGMAPPARADLIRARSSRAFPDIAGDIVGSQTYTYDPTTQTGTFAVTNAPHLISWGPTAGQMEQVLPDRDGTLSQSLHMKLDHQGKLVDDPNNRFEVRGTVVIGDRTYQGLLLEGKPTAFGAGEQQFPVSPKAPNVFDLNMEITGGQLALQFGKSAYLRIVPQANSTFSGQFTEDFSGDRPLTNLRAAARGLPTSIPEPSTLITIVTFGAAAVACKLRRSHRRRRSVQASGREASPDNVSTIDHP